MLKPTSHREPILHEILQKPFWQRPSPPGLAQPCSGISQCSNTSLRCSQFNQNPPTEYVMSQPPQIVKDKAELKVTFNCLLNHGFPFKDVDFGNILESGMLHMGKYTANEGQQRASHMHTKSKIR